jgi:hypothetical protein
MAGKRHRFTPCGRCRCPARPTLDHRLIDRQRTCRSKT